jgi:hypothetical protein
MESALYDSRELVVRPEPVENGASQTTGLCCSRTEVLLTSTVQPAVIGGAPLSPMVPLGLASRKTSSGRTLDLAAAGQQSPCREAVLFSFDTGRRLNHLFGVGDGNSPWNVQWATGGQKISLNRLLTTSQIPIQFGFLSFPSARGASGLIPRFRMSTGSRSPHPSV